MELKKLRVLRFLFWILYFYIVSPHPSSRAVVINEFLADPPFGLAGDANGDGIRNASDDEFVELMNMGFSPVDLSNWSLSDSAEIRHIFQSGTILAGQGRLVVFGGGDPVGISTSQTASTGRLSLNNSMDLIVLRNQNGIIIDSAAYGSEANNDQSLTRFSEGSGFFVLHSEVSPEKIPYSPGLPALPENRQISVAPEPSMHSLMLIVIAGLLFYKDAKKSRDKNKVKSWSR